MYYILKYLFPFDSLVLPIVLFLTCNSNYQIHRDSHKENKCNELGPVKKDFFNSKRMNLGALVIFGKILTENTNLNAVFYFLLSDGFMEL